MGKANSWLIRIYSIATTKSLASQEGASVSVPYRTKIFILEATSVLCRNNTWKYNPTEAEVDNEVGG